MKLYHSSHRYKYNHYFGCILFAQQQATGFQIQKKLLYITGYYRKNIWTKQNDKP